MLNTLVRAANTLTLAVILQEQSLVRAERLKADARRKGRNKMYKIYKIVYETVNQTHLGYFHPNTTRELGGKVLSNHLEDMTLRETREELSNLYQCVIDIALELKEQGFGENDKY